MPNFYSDERNTQMLVSLLKGHGIRRIIASPGTNNVNFVGTVQNDPYFEMYSCVDERSAAYMACGMAAETGEPVVITCTAATASRNYLPALTEAFYRKLPILAVTGTQHIGNVGNNMCQVIDRSVQMKDTLKMSVYIPASMPTKEDEWSSNLLINRALLELRHNGGGPVHINLQTNFTPSSCSKLPKEERVIHRICYNEEFPPIPCGKIGIFVGAHMKWDKQLTSAVDIFCAKYNAVVLCDNTSNYWGKYRVLAQLITYQSRSNYEPANFSLIIHIGDISGSKISFNAKEVWRVNPDGEIRDTFKKLNYVFEMEEKDFFEFYVRGDDSINEADSQYQLWKSEYNRIYSKIPELPFSNIWVAKNTVNRLSENSTIHFGIWNSLMSWNYFEMPRNTLGYCNTGGFGIDGIVSTVLGASLMNPEKPYFCVLGDLAFFYDMNALGNRHVGKNLRILMINNGCGVQFHLSGNYSQRVGISDSDVHKFIAAGGHFEEKAPGLTKHYVEDLGFEYISAHNKDEFLNVIDYFVNPKIYDRPVFLEVIVDYHDDCKAEDIIRSVDATVSRETRNKIKNVIGEKNVQAIKKIIKK